MGLTKVYMSWKRCTWVENGVHELKTVYMGWKRCRWVETGVHQLKTVHMGWKRCTLVEKRCTWLDKRCTWVEKRVKRVEKRCTWVENGEYGLIWEYITHEYVCILVNLITTKNIKHISRSWAKGWVWCLVGFRGWVWCLVGVQGVGLGIYSIIYSTCLVPSGENWGTANTKEGLLQSTNRIF